MNLKISSKIAFFISGSYTLAFLIFTIYKGFILYLVQKTMEDTFIGGNASDISITLWFIVSGILAFISILFFYFMKIRDLKSQIIILNGVTVSWIFISMFQIFLFKNYFYLSLLNIIPIIICYQAIKNLNTEIIKEYNKKDLTENEIHLLQLLAGIKKK